MRYHILWALLGIISNAWAAPAVTWQAVTEPNLDKHARLGGYRDSGGALHLTWRHVSSDKSEELLYRKLDSEGQIASNAETAVAAWQALANPDVLVDDTGRISVYFGGFGPDTVNYHGKLVAVRKAGAGAPWILDAAPLGPNEAAYSADGIRSIFDSLGRPVHAYAGTDLYYVIEGIGETQMNQDCCVSNADLAVDAVSGKVILGWQSTGNPHYVQVVQEILPMLGILEEQPIKGLVSGPLPMAARPGLGGVYTAACAGSHFGRVCSQILINNFGGNQLIRVPGARNVRPETLSLVAGDGGAIWAAWTDSKGRVYLNRSNSNKGFPRFVKPAQIRKPSKNAEILSLELMAYRDSVDILAISQDGAGVGGYHTRVSSRSFGRLPKQ